MQLTDLLLYGVFVIGAAMSLFAFFWGRRLRREALLTSSRLRENPNFQAILEGGLAIGGETVVDAPDPAAVMQKLQLQLENPQVCFQSPFVRALHRRGRLQLLPLQDLQLSFSGEDLLVSEGLVCAEAGAEPGKVRVHWAVRTNGLGWLISLGQAWALGLGLTASVLVPILIFLYVANSPDPAVRAQMAQVVQVGQVLWEPYLFLGLASRRLRGVGRYLETLIASAAYEARTGRSPTPQMPFTPA